LKLTDCKKEGSKTDFPDADISIEADRAEIRKLEEDYNFLNAINKGAEFMSEESIKRVEDIAGRKWIMGGEPQNLLTDDEIQNLNIRKGTLTDEERTIINSHAAITFKMLSQMPFPKN